MKLTAAFLVSSLFVTGCIIVSNGKRIRNITKKSVKLDQKICNIYEMSDGTIDFPHEMMYTMHVQGEVTRDIQLRRNPFVQMPRENSHKIRKYAFYTEVNTGESFACKVKHNNGNVECDIAGITEKKSETCYFSPNSNMADCESADSIADGKFLVLDDNNQVIDQCSMNRSNKATVTIRMNRSIFPEAGFKVVEVVFVADQSFMLPFYNRNPGNDLAAEEEAELFITLFANEISVYYQSVKEASSGQLDLVIYPSAFRFPAKGTNFYWSQNNINGTDVLIADYALNDFIFYTETELTGIQFDHAMALTGLDLSTLSQGTQIYGVTFFGTVCRPNSFKVSMLENIGFNLGWIASHELGHALGAIHDIDAGCTPAINIMAEAIFNITAATQNTYNRFSICSVDDFMSHLNSYPDCTAVNGFTDEQFRSRFCSGLLGATMLSLDRQCQVRTGSSTASACTSTVSADACFLTNQVMCRSSPTEACSSSLLFVWNGTPCGANTGYQCYRGSCVAEFDICQTSTSKTTSTSSIATSTSATKTPTSSTKTSTSTARSSLQTTSACTCCVYWGCNRFYCCNIAQNQGLACCCCF